MRPTWCAMPQQAPSQAQHSTSWPPQGSISAILAWKLALTEKHVFYKMFCGVEHGPKMAHCRCKKPYDNPSSAQDGSNLAPTSPPHRSTCIPHDPTWPNMIPTWPQHKMAQDGPQCGLTPPPLPGRWQAVRRKPLNPAMPWQLAVRGDSARRCSIASVYSRPTPKSFTLVVFSRFGAAQHG